MMCKQKPNLPGCDDYKGKVDDKCKCTTKDKKKMSDFKCMTSCFDEAGQQKKHCKSGDK